MNYRASNPIVGIAFIWLLIGFAQGARAQLEISSDEHYPLEIGESRTLASEVLGENRSVNIYLPTDYHPDSAATYPVVYLLDGGMEEDFIHVAGLIQFATFPWIEMMPKSILVGIENVDRKRDFTYPTSSTLDQKEFPTAGHSQEFIDFIEKELKPFISKNYNASDESMLIGQSLGGLVATEILFTRPLLFDRYMIVSPSLWWDDESLLKKDLEIPDGISVYVAVGEEGEIMVRLAKELATKMEGAFGTRTGFEYAYYPELDHGDVLHLAVYHGFISFYPRD